MSQSNDNQSSPSVSGGQSGRATKPTTKSRPRKSNANAPAPSAPALADAEPLPVVAPAPEPAPITLINSPRWNYTAELYYGTDLIETHVIPRPPLDVPHVTPALATKRRGKEYTFEALVGNAVIYRATH